MDLMALFTMGTGGHYITTLPADWSISTSQDPLPSSCHSEKMLWNPSIGAHKENGGKIFKSCNKDLSRETYTPGNVSIQRQTDHTPGNIHALPTPAASCHHKWCGQGGT